MVKIVHGNILTTQSGYICHQCNTVTSEASGIAKSIFSMFPEADDYKRGTHGRFGSIKTHGRIVNMFSQKLPGKAGGYGDSQEERVQAFSRCLSQIEALTPRLYLFPYAIGCGLAGGNWDETYLDMIIEMGSRLGNDANIVIHKLKGEPKRKRYY